MGVAAKGNREHGGKTWENSPCPFAGVVTSGPGGFDGILHLYNRADVHSSEPVRHVVYGGFPGCALRLVCVHCARTQVRHASCGAGSPVPYAIMGWIPNRKVLLVTSLTRCTVRFRYSRTLKSSPHAPCVLARYALRA